MLRFSSKNIKKFLVKKNLINSSLIAILGSSLTFQSTAFCEENNEKNSSNIAQNTNATDEKNENHKIDPTADVAGGLGEKGRTPPKYAVLQTGKTLPEGIFKIDLPLAYSFGNQGFDSNGKKVDNGISMKRFITGIAIQYGLTNSLSVAVGFPYTASYQLGMNGDSVAANSELYAKYYNHVLHDLSTKLSQNANGFLCGSNVTPDTCASFINGGGSLNNSTTLTIPLPTGETFTFNSASPLKDQIRNILLTASQPTNGATGLGDIQVGVLWSVISEESPIRHVPLYFSVGGGLRIPTGKFNLVTAMRSTGGDGTLITGGGTYDAIARLNLDYVVIPGVILSWQHQAEYSINKVNLRRTSMLDNTSFNTADTSTGDGQGNDLEFWRKGLHHIGFLQASWGLGNVSSNFKWLGLYTQAKYNIAAKAYLNGQPVYTVGDQFYLGESSMHPDHGYEQYYSVVVGSKFSGLPYMIPAEFSAEFEYPYAGYNRMVSPMNAKGVLSIYF
nr:hypothetical protein GTC16762_15410 [Pigmentibacter ruber]